MNEGIKYFVKENRIVKKTFFFLIAMILTPYLASAFQQVSNPSEISVAVGGSNNFQYTFYNDENGPVTLFFRVEGDASKYISQPPSVSIAPGKYSNASFGVTIPSNYSGSSNIRGDIFVFEQPIFPTLISPNSSSRQNITISVTPKNVQGIPVGSFLQPVFVVPAFIFGIIVVASLIVVFKKRNNRKLPV